MTKTYTILLLFHISSVAFTRAEISSIQETERKAQSLTLASFREQDPCRVPNPDHTYFCPPTRYCNWMENAVSNREAFKNELGYTRRNWDYLGRVNDELEYKAWSELTVNQTVTLNFIGFHPDSHDCCHGHYISHDWSDFENDAQYADVKATWELLGYNEDNWSTVDLQNLIPPYGSMSWEELPEDVRSAVANSLCYNKELWDDITINSWVNTTILPGTFQMTSSGELVALAALSAEDIATLNDPVPVTLTPTGTPTNAPIVTDSPTPPPTELPTASPTPSPTDSPVQTIPVETSPPTKQLTPEPTPAPTSDPTPSPTTTPVTSSPTTTSVIDETGIVTFELEEQTPCKELNPDTLYFCPPARYCLWDHYVESTQQLLSTELNYSRESWNYEINQLNDIEFVQFVDLTERQQAALIAIGFTPQTHDCCHSHFATYEWEELFVPEFSVIATSVTLLGYTEETWNAKPTPQSRFRSPIYANTNWDDLPRRVKFGARSLCYSRELWDRIPIPVWSEFAITPGSNEREPANIPRPPTPSAPVTSRPSNVPTLIPLPTTCRDLNNVDFDYKCPVQRYCEWDYYDTTARQFLQFQIGYDRISWNYESGISSIHPLELTPFEDLSKSIQDGLIIFFDGVDYTPDTHDCCLGHYTGYDWDELDIVKPNVKEAWKVLGFDESSWVGTTQPLYADFSWDDLPPDVQTVATKFLCYSEETWDGIPLTSWPDDTVLPGQIDPNDTSEDDIIVATPPLVEVKDDEEITPIIPPCHELDANVNYKCPTARYCEWDSFDLDTKQTLMFQVGYSEPDWNYEATNPIEEFSFANVNIFVKTGLREIGYDADSHNCCLNHYTDFSWNDFENTNALKNVLATYQKLGYTKDTWENNQSPELEEEIWEKLPKDLQTMLFDHLCYNEELWDGITLDEWPKDAILPGSSMSVLPEDVTTSSSIVRWTPSWSIMFLSQLCLWSSLLSILS